MRINKYIAQNSGLSRRVIDEYIGKGKVLVNGRNAEIGQSVSDNDLIVVDGQELKSTPKITILFNKPVGYVCSRQGQGSQTIYDILPDRYNNLKTVGRLDKQSSGLLLLTSDGDLAYQLTHPSQNKTKTYEIVIDKPLEPLHQQMISDIGIELEDGPSRLYLSSEDKDRHKWVVQISEGRNRQIRRTFEKLGYKVIKLHRTGFGPYHIGNLKPGETEPL